MVPLKARVHNGRLVLDEPTELPEGEVVYLGLVEASVSTLDGPDEGERAAIVAAIDHGIAEARAGQHTDAEELVNELLNER